MGKFDKEQQLRRQVKKYAFSLYMKQAPDGKHLYNNAKIAEMVNRGAAKGDAKKITKNTIQKWAVKTNEDGTTWKGSFFKALARAHVRKVTPKVTPIDSAKKKSVSPKTDTSPAMEIEAAAIMGQKIMADAQRRVGETSYVLDFIVKVINNDIASTLRKRKEAGREMALDDIKKLFTTKGVKFIYDYWRYNVHIITERLKIESGEDINDIDEMLEYLETFAD